MNFINVFVASSLVLVAIVFLYFLYQNQRIKNFSEFDYDVDPQQDEFANTHELICPPDYYYDHTENEKDICISNNKEKETLSFDTLQKKGKIQYPNIEDKFNLEPMRDRCQYSEDWPQITPYCNYLSVSNN